MADIQVSVIARISGLLISMSSFSEVIDSELSIDRAFSVHMVMGLGECVGPGLDWMSPDSRRMAR